MKNLPVSSPLAEEANVSFLTLCLSRDTLWRCEQICKWQYPIHYYSTACFFFFLNSSFTEIQFAYYEIHPFRAQNSMFFSNSQNSTGTTTTQFQNAHYPIMKPCIHEWGQFPFPSAHSPQSLLPVAMGLPILEILCKWNHIV